MVLIKPCPYLIVAAMDLRRILCGQWSLSDGSQLTLGQPLAYSGKSQR